MGARLFLVAIVLTLAVAILALLAHRIEASRLSKRLSDLAEAKRKGTHRARLQYPDIDLTRCIGCGTCVNSCPEEGVLDLVHGQAVVIHGARCVGHGRCAAACPVGAISLTLGDLRDRNDIPALTDKFEVPNMPGLFLAGELTGYALVRTAIAHGTSIILEVSSRLTAQARKPSDGSILDVCIVGAGPAGIAASLQAKALGLRFVTIEQETLGGTVSKYPRRKLVMTQPVTLPLYGRLRKTSYTKEELMQLWSELTARYDLPVSTGEEFVGVERNGERGLIITTKARQYQARFACLALGRRGTPRKLGVPGEDLSKVAYHLIDAQSYCNRRILVVGGGDSAIEAALGLAEQPGNEVTLSYRGETFLRLKSRNEARVNAAVRDGRIRCLFESQLKEITPNSVCLEITSGGQHAKQLLKNNDVFVMAGGIPPFQLLEKCGVSFRSEDRPATVPLADRGTGLLNSLLAALLAAVMALAWVLRYHNYYGLPRLARPLSALHALLRPSSPFGLAAGITATLLILLNLCYLLRRNVLREWMPGSLSGWMTLHVGTGICAFLLVLLHAALLPRHSLGGHALAALAFLVLTGAIGRYFYSFIPRAANGKELALEHLQSRIAVDATQWDRLGRGFGEEVQDEVHTLLIEGKWDGSLLRRLFALLRSQAAINNRLRRIRESAREEGLSSDQVDRLTALAHQAYRTALLSAHYEDLRSILNSWRFLHRWVALLLVMLALAHIYIAMRYGRLLP